MLSETFNEAQACEQEIELHVESLLRDYLAVERNRSWPGNAQRARFLQEFEKFMGWVSGCGVSVLPCSAHAAFYLVDLALKNVPTGDIVIAADAIIFTHDAAEKFIDRIPIDAVLTFIVDRAKAETVGTRH
jgi:hypothetical protein